MSKFTDFLKLFKWDTKSATDLEEDYDIDTAVNPNWDKIDENAIIVNERLNKLENNGIVSNKYARALPGQVQDQSFTQIYADSPVVEGLEIKGKELTQKTRDDKNKFTTTFSQNGTTRIKSGTIKVEESTQYTFSAISTLGHTLQYAVNYYNAENTLISSSPYYGNGGSFTTPENTKSINIQVRDFENSGVNNTINVSEVIEAQLELGSSATEYQEPGVMPSIEHPSEIENVANSIKVYITGKNFLGYKENGTANSQGVTAEYENGVFTLNGTVTQERDLYFNLIDVLSINSYANQSNQPKRKLFKNKYTISYKHISGTKSPATMHFLLVDKVANSTSKFNISSCHYNDKNITINITEDLEYYAYFWLPKNMTFTDFKFKIQLEVGENITEIEPYKNKSFNITLPEGKFLSGINNNKNIITKINGIWKLKKCIKRISFNGTEDWEMDSTGVYHILKSKIPGMNLPYNSIDMICNCFLVTTGSTAIGTFRVGTSYLNFNYDDGIGGLANWKAKLVELNNAGTPLTVYYLTDEEEEELPEATKTLLNSIELYEDINNIGVEGGTVSFKYNKSLARAIEELYILAGATQESEVSANEQ